MSSTASTLDEETAFDLRLGPLCYRFESHDDWGHARLREISDNLAEAPASASPDRIIHLGRKRPDNSAPWDHFGSPLGTIACRAGSPHTAWTTTADSTLPQFRYHLPWALILTDMVTRSGAIAHAGFAARNGMGVLFLAPPGGGKSTTLASVPSDWEVLSDDAALVWAEGDNWQASPLPSWTMMTAAGPPSPPELRFDSGQRRRLAGVIVLVKGERLRLEPLPPVAAAPHLFRALGEYPSTVLAALPLEEHFFRAACTMARALPCRRLELPLGGSPWPLLAELLEGSP